MIKYSNYNWNLPFTWLDDEVISIVYEGENYVVEDVRVDIDTDVNTQAFAFGLGLGGQWLVQDVISLGIDFGLGWGFSWGDGTLTIIPESIDIPNFDESSVDPEAIELLIYEVAIDAAEDIEEGFVEFQEDDEYPFTSQFDLEVEADRNTINAEGNIPWFILRLGFTVGFAF